MPELPEVEVIRRDLEKEVVGKKVKAVDVTGMRSIRRYRQRKQFTGALVGKKFMGVERRGKYLLVKLDGGEVLVDPPRHVGPAPAGRGHQGGAGQAHPRGHHLHPGRPAAVHRPAHVRRDVRDRARRHRGPGRRARPPRPRPARERHELGLLRRAGGPAAHEAEGRADGPEVHRRHRQHLLRRDPASRRAALRPDERRAAARGGAAPLPGRGRGAPGRREVPRVVARRRAVRGPVREEGRVPGAPPGVRPRRAGVPALPARRSCARSTPAGRRSSARSARCDARSSTPARDPRDRRKPRVRSGIGQGGAAECS